jgi:hypothetical protein
MIIASFSHIAHSGLDFSYMSLLVYMKVLTSAWLEGQTENKFPGLCRICPKSVFCILENAIEVI